MNTQQKWVLLLATLLMIATLVVAPFRILKSPQAGHAPVEVDTEFRLVWRPKPTTDSADRYEVDRSRQALQALGIAIMAALTVLGCAEPRESGAQQLQQSRIG